MAYFDPADENQHKALIASTVLSLFTNALNNVDLEYTIDTGQYILDDLLFAYETYFNTAIDVDAFTSGWTPTTLRFFATEEYLNVWVPLPASEHPHAFDYLYNLSE